MSMEQNGKRGWKQVETEAKTVWKGRDCEKTLMSRTALCSGAGWSLHEGTPGQVGAGRGDDERC